MPIRGETVGTAYVRILADGSELPGQLEDQLRGEEDAFRAQGRRDAQAYKEAFEKGFGRDASLINLQQALNRSIAQADLTRDFFEGPQWSKFEVSLEKRFGEAGRRAALEFSQSFGEKGSLAGLENAIEGINPRIAKLRRELVDESERIAADFEASFRHEIDTIDRETNRLFANISRDLDQHRAALIRTQTATTELFGSVERDAKKASKEIEEFAESSERMQHRSSHAFRTVANDFDRLAVPLGRLLGKGSRNNFLNFFGSVITNVLRLGTVVFRVFDFMVSAISGAVRAISGFLNTLGQNVAKTASRWEGFLLTLSTGTAEGIFATVATGGLNLVAAVAAMGIAFAVATITAGALIVVLELLGGVVIALAATVEFALIAALSSIGPLLIPLAAIILGVIAAVEKFKNATGPLEKSLDRVAEEAKDLYTAFKNRAFKDAPKLVDRIAVAMKGLDKFVKAAGDGVANFTKALVDSITGPEFKAFTDAFTQFLPSASRKLGIILGNVFEGLGGFLRASIPLANQLLNWLIKITENFSEFTNTREGQEAIKDFLTEAAESARSLGNFLGAAARLIQEVLSSGRDTGDSIFDSMANALDRVTTWLQENPDAVEQFFRDVRDTATQAGGVIEDLVAALDRIDNPETRRAAKQIIALIGEIIVIAGKAIEFGTAVGGAIVKVFEFLVEGLRKLIVLSLEQFRTFGIAMIIMGQGIGGPIGAALEDAGGKIIAFSTKSITNINKVAASFDDMADGMKTLPSVDLNTEPAMGKLNLLATTIAGIQQAINNLNAAAAAAGPGGDNPPTRPPPGAQESVDRRTPQRANIEINVVTPTTDPRGVAVELANRLVAMGY